MQEAAGHNRTIRRWWAILLWLLLSMPFARADTVGAKVLVVGGGDGDGLHVRFVDGLRRRLTRIDPKLALRVSSRADARTRIAAWHPALIVTVGTRAATRMAHLAPAVPVVNALVPEAFYLSLYAGARPRFAHSAIYIDQPLGRTLDLVAVALPGTHRVAALLGPISARRLSALRRAAAQHGMALTVETLDNAEGLDAALGRLLRHDAVLLALPDPVVVNGRTAKQWILGAYLRRAALVGYSRAFVKAGALMAVYSTPEQVGASAAEAVAAALRTPPVRLPAPRSPGEFNVSVNYELARALGIRLPAQDVLKARLKAREEAP